MEPVKKTVLIAGGGFAGLSVAYALRGSYNCVLVDPKTYWEHIPVAPHSFVSPSSASATLVEYPAFLLHKQGLLVGLASDGKKGEATLQGGETLPFDYAVLCTGSSYPAEVKPSDTQLTDKASRLQQFADIKAKIEAAATVVVVGGGAVGVEIASEVKEAHPDKQVTLICGESLLGRMDPKAGEFAAQWFKKHGVEVLVGERISDWGGLGDGLPGAATLTTAGGRTIQGDLVFKCLGVTPATGLYAASLGGEQLAGNGALAVEPTLQVKGWPNVFAAGDCTDVKEEKTAALAGMSAMVAAANVISLDQGKELQTYPEGLFGHAEVPMVGGTALGTKAGIFQMGSDLQIGAGPAYIHSMIAWIWVRVAGGSRWWGWVYAQMKKVMLKGMVKEAAKAAAAKKTAAGAATAIAPAAA